MSPIGSIVSGAAMEVGLMAGSIAVGGFIAHAIPALRGKDDMALRSATVSGGLGGLGVAILITAYALLSA